MDKKLLLKRRSRLRKMLAEQLEDRRMLFSPTDHANLIAGALPLSSTAVQKLVASSNSVSETNNDPEARRDYNHFFGSAFSKSAAKINERFVAAVKAADPSNFLKTDTRNASLSTIAENFGRILHAAQDFYAHTNWVDLIQGEYLQATSLVDTGLDYWPNLTPYSLVSTTPQSINSESFDGVMLIEDDSLIESIGKSITPAGDVTGHKKFTLPSAGDGNQDLNLASVQTKNRQFLGVVSGTFLLTPDHTPDAVAYSFDTLDKSSLSSSMHEAARTSAASQTEHEFLRLLSLIQERWGTIQHILDAWVPLNQQTDILDALTEKINSGRSLQSLAAEVESGKIRHVTVVTHGFQLDEEDGDSLKSLAEAIQYRTGGWLVDYDVPAENERGYFQLSELPTKSLGETRTVRLIAQNAPVSITNFSKDLKFQLAITDQQGITYLRNITLSKESTNDNISIADLANDLETAVNESFSDTSFGGKLLVDLYGDKLALTSDALEIIKIAINADSSLAFLSQKQIGFANSQSAEPDGHVVLLFDWAAESNNFSAGWTQAAGDALFSMLNRLGLVNPASGSSQKVTFHFIAHSFGSAVTSEAVERLGRFNVSVDQVTFLDPHDFDQPITLVDENQDQSSLNLPEGYGATIWDNVVYADVYYQNELTLLPNGRPILGAANFNVTNDSLVKWPNSHSDVWSELYRETIIDTSIRPFGYRFSRNFERELQSNADSSFTRAPARFFDSSQDHFYTEPAVLYSVRLPALNAPPNTGALPQDIRFGLRLWNNLGAETNYQITIPKAATSNNGILAHLAEDMHNAIRLQLQGTPFDGKTLVDVQNNQLIVFARGDAIKKLQLVDLSGSGFLKLSSLGFQPDQNATSYPYPEDYRAPTQWSTSIYNGDFQFVGNPAFVGERMIPGWSQHGGGGPATIGSADGNSFLVLDNSGRWRTHNSFYLDPETKVLRFDLAITEADPLDRLAVYIGDRLVQTYDLLDTSDALKTLRFTVPDDLLGTTQTLPFRLVHGFYSIELAAEQPPGSLVFNNDLKFQIELSDKSGVSTPFTVTIPKIVSSDNLTIDDIAKDLEQAITSAILASPFANTVTSSVRDGKLTILAQGNVVDKVYLRDLSGSGFLRLSHLGFFNGQEGFAENIDASVRVDNIRLENGGHTGDLLEVDLKKVIPTATSFGVVGWELLDVAGTSDSVSLNVRENQLRGDHHLGLVLGKTDAFVIFSDQLDRQGNTKGQPFSSTGRFVLAPPTWDNLLGDSDAETPGFSGRMRMTFRVGETPLAQVTNSNPNKNNVSLVLTALNDPQANWQQVINQNWELTSTSGSPFRISESATKSVRNIFKGDTSDIVTYQWQIESDGQKYAIILREDRFDLFPVHSIEFSILPGTTVASNDVQNVIVNAASRLDVARMQQRLRYFNYPDESGEVLVVDGIVGPHTRHATGLFIASTTETTFKNADVLTDDSALYANAINGPRWQELIPSTLVKIVQGPYAPNTPPRFHGTSWLIDSIYAAATVLNQEVLVGAISAENGPGTSPYHHPGHDAGLSVDFLLPSTGPNRVDDLGNGILSDAENKVVQLILAMERYGFEGISIAEVITSNSDIADAINENQLTPIATVDPTFAGGIHVKIAPPLPITSIEPDPVIDQDIQNAFEEILNWLDKLIDVQLDKQLPALVEAQKSTDGSSSGDPTNANEKKPATISNALNLKDLLKTNSGNPEKKSTFDLIKDTASSLYKNDIYQLAELLTRTEVDFFLNLPTSNLPALVSFDPTNDPGSIDSFTYRFRVPISVFDAVGSEHKASVFFTDVNSDDTRWAVRLVTHPDSTNLGIGQLVDTVKEIEFDPATGRIKTGTPNAIVFGGFRASAQLKPVDIRLYLTDATWRDDIFKGGWTAWGTAAQANFNRKTFQADLNVRVIGAGNTGDRKFDFTEELSKLGGSIPDVLSASLSLDGLLDFNISWLTKSNKPLSETITLQLNQFKADIGLLVDQIMVDASSKLGILEARIIDEPSHPGFNSYISGGAGFEVKLNQGKATSLNALNTAEIGSPKGVTVDVTCDLHGVLFFESTIAGQPIPGQFWLSLGLYSTQIVAKQPPVSTSDYAEDTKFVLNLTDQTGIESSYTVTLPASATQGNASLPELAADLEDAISATLAGTKFAGAVTAVAIGDKLAVVSHGNAIKKIALNDLGGNGFYKLARLGFENGQVEQVPQDLKIDPKGDLVDLLNKLKKLDLKQLANSMQQVGAWLTSLGNSGPFTGSMPLGGGAFGKYGDIGEEVEKALFEKLLEVLMIAEAGPQAINFSDSTKFLLEINGQSFHIVMEPSITSDNKSVQNLAADLTAVINTTLENSDLAGALIADVVDNKLALRSTGTLVKSLKVSNSEDETTFAGVERLGFGNGQSVDDLRLQTLQDLERMFEEALRLEPHEFDLNFDNQTNQITASISTDRESILGSTSISLPSELGGLGIATSNSTIELWRRVEADFKLGIDLNDVGSNYSFDESTHLSSLPTWLTGIETGLLSTLPASHSGRPGKAVQFSLIFTTSEVSNHEITVQIDTAETSENQSLNDLASDLTAAINEAMPTSLQGSVQAVTRSDGKLQLVLTSTDIVNIEIRDIPTTKGDVARLGSAGKIGSNLETICSSNSAMAKLPLFH